MAQRVDLFEKSFGFFLLELSYLLKEFVDLRKKMLKDDPIDPSNLGESIQKADKDIQSKDRQSCEIKLTAKTQQIRNVLMKIHKQIDSISFFLKVNPQKSLRDIHQRNSKKLVSHKPKFKQ